MLSTSWSSTSSGSRSRRRAAWRTGRPPESGLVWSRDGASVIYTTEPAPETFYLWRAWITGDRAPERLELAGLGARMPTVASARESSGVRRARSTASASTRSRPAPRPVLVTSFWDIQPQFSPDGTQLVFTSSRSGEGLDVWLASADGSSPRQLTHGPGAHQGSPSWSPDGRRIAFDSSERRWPLAHLDHRRRRRRSPPDHEGARRSEHADLVPGWALDLLLTPTRVHGDDTWRVPATGGSPERVTRDGSTVFAVESMDGKDLIYKRTLEDSPLLALPLAGGPARQLLPCVIGRELCCRSCRHLLRSLRSWPGASPFTCWTELAEIASSGAPRPLGLHQLNRLAVSPDGRDHPDPARVSLQRSDADRELQVGPWVHGSIGARATERKPRSATGRRSHPPRSSTAPTPASS